MLPKRSTQTRQRPLNLTTTNLQPQTPPAQKPSLSVVRVDTRRAVVRASPPTRLPRAVTSRSDFVITHRELVANLTVDTTTTVAFKAFPLNAGSTVTFPWLSTLSTCFDMYRILHLGFTFEPSVSQLTSGTYVMAADYDAVDTTSQRTMGYYATMTGAINRKITERSTFTLDVSRFQTAYASRFVAKTSSDNTSRTSTYGSFFFLSSPTTNATALGNLWVDYTIAFRNPELIPSNLSTNNMLLTHSANPPPLPLIASQSTATQGVHSPYSTTDVIYGQAPGPASSVSARATQVVTAVGDALLLAASIYSILAFAKPAALSLLLGYPLTHTVQDAPALFLHGPSRFRINGRMNIRVRVTSTPGSITQIRPAFHSNTLALSTDNLSWGYDTVGTPVFPLTTSVNFTAFVLIYTYELFTDHVDNLLTPTVIVTCAAGTTYDLESYPFAVIDSGSEYLSVAAVPRYQS